RAVAANLLVRRTAFERLDGFAEGVRAGEDTDFCWRLQRAGWRLELRAGAAVQHRYRATLSELRRQWRGYAAGRAWLARRYPGFAPQPAAARALRRAAAGRATVRDASDDAARTSPNGRPERAAELSRRDRVGFLAVDVLLAAE